ncbi:MAG TPA: c-type cytochrome [Actinomycetota bacterium]|nr:c-type cytochrome [Actinomycetota bacterium]
MRGLRRAALLLVLLGACNYADEQAAPYRPAIVVATPLTHSGEQLYLRDCAWCHGRAGEGSERGPDIVSDPSGPALVDFVVSTGRMPISSPDELMRPGSVDYSPQEIAALVAYSRTLEPAGPDVPELSLDDVDLALGGRLYQENCAACHSTTGIGGALTKGRAPADGSRRSGFVAPDLHRSTPLQVAEAIRTGPGTMPVFGLGVFEDEELNAIVGYVSYLRDPSDRGGAPIGRIGPVAEGAIGWLIGLGLLIVFARWIGTKRGEG